MMINAPKDYTLTIQFGERVYPARLSETRLAVWVPSTWRRAGRFDGRHEPGKVEYVLDGSMPIRGHNSGTEMPRTLSSAMLGLSTSPVILETVGKLAKRHGEVVHANMTRARLRGEVDKAQRELLNAALANFGIEEAATHYRETCKRARDAGAVL